LEALLEIGIKSYIFYQPSKTIFHPKIYLFEGKKVSHLIIGSSNITSAGLFSNVETSVLFSIDNTIDSDKQVIHDIKTYFKGIFNTSDPNLKKLNKKLIGELVKIKVVPTEAERSALHDITTKTESKKAEIAISKIFPKRSIEKAPVEFRGTCRLTVRTKIDLKPATGRPLENGKIIWTRRKLPASSVQSAGSGTNPTGGLRLVQDKFVYKGKIIDQTSYFRKTVFGKFSWKQVSQSPYVEVTSVPFNITVKDKYLGKHILEIRHKPTGEAGQHNYTTSISWGDLGETIRDSNLTGARLDIFAPVDSEKSFHIVIS
jgi:hypothetical protein